MNNLLKIVRKAGVSFVAYADDLLIIASGQTGKQPEDSGNFALIESPARKLNVIFRFHITNQ